MRDIGGRRHFLRRVTDLEGLGGRQFTSIKQAKEAALACLAESR